jgi:hypothetical protein
MPDFSFTPEEILQIKKTTELYLLFKDLLLEAEELDDERKTQPQILIELRNALEHLMRTITKKFAPEQEQNPGYITKTLDKFLGHVYRAGYDVLDWQSIVLRGKIIKALKRFSFDAIKEVLPDYYSTIRPAIEKISQDIASIRKKKDIDGVFDASFENFKMYADKVHELQTTYREKILPAVNSIAEVNRKKKWTDILKVYLPWIVPFLGGLLLGIFGFS